MKIILTSYLIFVALFGFTQNKQDSVTLEKLDLKNYCNNNFSLTKKDSTFTNFYVSNYRDTIFFKSANCIVTVEPSTPPTFKRRILDGWAEGELQIFLKNDSTYSWTYGSFREGVLVQGSIYQYYENDKVQLTGQYLYGHKYGVWTWYYENGQIERIVTYERAEPIKEIEFDKQGKIIEQYDVIRE